MRFATLQRIEGMSIGPSGRRGIQRYGNRVILLISAKSPYRDLVGDGRSRITFQGEGARGDQTFKRGNKLLNSLVRTGVRVSVYQCLQKNNWERLGSFTVRGAVRFMQDGRFVINFSLHETLRVPRERLRLQQEQPPPRRSPRIRNRV